MSTVPDKPLKLFQPMNMVYFLAFYSPIVLIIGITGLSFIFQNFKGLIYLLFLIGSCFLRSIVYQWGEINMDESGFGEICKVIRYTKHGNFSFSPFVYAFTIVYLSFPMFANGTVNYWVFSLLTMGFFLDLFIRGKNNCFGTGNARILADVAINTISGGAIAALLVSLMYAGGSSEYLFFNELSSDKQVCYQPSKQTFKCHMYKNGELIGQI
jgi:hypothetical protein